MILKKKEFLIRTLWGTLVAIFLIFILHYFDNDWSIFSGVKAFILPLWIISLFNFIFHGLLWLDGKLDQTISWFDFPKKRLVVEAGIVFPSILVIILFNYAFLKKFSTQHEIIGHQRFIYMYIIVMIVLLVVLSIFIARNFFKNWKKSLLDFEKLKQEKMRTDYLALQNQLNPHFLFNNFNMLVAEIRRDPENAVYITEKLADVYRYVLESKNHETISLREEVEFIESIVFLYKVRFGRHLKINLDLPDEINDYRIPPLTLQILIENAIKHNIVSAAHPLHIDIIVENHNLRVTNNLQLKKSSFSTNLGLKNIKMRYSFLTERQVKVQTNENQFIVDIPLLQEN